MLLPLLRHVVQLNHGNCRLSMRVVNGLYARDGPTPSISTCLNPLNRILPQWNIFCKHIWRLQGCFWHQLLQEFPMNSASDWNYKYGHTRSSSLHIRLFDTGHMQLTAMEKIMVFRAKNPHYHVIIRHKITMEHFFAKSKFRLSKINYSHL